MKQEARSKEQEKVMVFNLPSSFLNLPSRALLTLLLLTTLSYALTQDLDREVFNISRQLRCPVCVAESVADSGAEVSVEMRNIVQAQLEEGKSEAEILAYFQARYGDWILLEPPKRGFHLLVWILPLAAGLIGLVVLGFLFKRWTRASRQPIEVDDADLRRVREALEQSR